MGDESPKKTNVSPLLLIILIVLLVTSGLGGWLAPHYSHWDEFDDCKLLEGKVIEKGWTSKKCIGEDMCYYDYYIVVQDENDKNHTIHVSPIMYAIQSEGGTFNSYYC
ncbi:hypothetical protein CL614_02780 [archaeon]|nr:hypothetical protein [archaeon]|tara:strand:- start:1616 stop:1939 length:324 start_codon:yes stop_codon:yes gene_type:complete